MKSLPDTKHEPQQPKLEHGAPESSHGDVHGLQVAGLEDAGLPHPCPEEYPALDNDPEECPALEDPYGLADMTLDINDGDDGSTLATLIS